MNVCDMYRSVRLESAKGSARSVWIKVCVIGLVGIFYSTCALADPGAELETEALIGAQIDTLTDNDLSMIDGKGWTAEKLEANEMLAVILWDERGSGSTRRTTINSIDGNNNYQSVSLTVNQR